MPVTDPLGNRCDRVVRVHFRELYNALFDLSAAVSCAQRLYGRYRIYFHAVSVETVRVPLAAQSRLARIQTECLADSSSPEQAELYTRYGVQDLSSITAFIVQQIHKSDPSRTSYGCGASAPHQPSVIISGDACDWVLAHEVGHVLLGKHASGHSEGPNDIMRAGYKHTATEANPEFNGKQLYALRQSPYCLPC